MHQDEEHLRLLSIFYYVCAGFAAFGACLWAVIIIIGIVLQISPDALGPHNNDPEELSDLGMTIFAAAFCLVCVAFAICLMLVGKSISQRKRYTFCLVTAGFACLLFPFGTVLGIFTLIVLVRPSVKALYDRATPFPPAFSQ